MSTDTYGVNPLAPDAPPRPDPRDPAAPADKVPDRILGYDGERGPLFGIVLRNTLLGVVTLGFYRFWGKTRLRRYLWAHLRLFGDRLEYTGTAKELFLGFLIALGILIPLGIGFGIVEFLTSTAGPVTQVIVNVVYYLVFGFLIGVAIFRARHYQMTRTAWRGIRFGQSGSSVRYSLMWLGYTALTLLTLGIARPVGDVGLQRYVIDHTWLGSIRFGFDGRAGPLMGRWLLCLVLVPFTLGLSLLWYSALLTRYYASCTRFSALGIEMPVTFRDLAGIYIPYYLALAVIFGSLGVWMDIGEVFSGEPRSLPIFPLVLFFVFILFIPALQVIMVAHRALGLVAERLAVSGHVDLDAIVQQAQMAPRTGEGLADALDVGGGVEVGF